MTLPLCEFVPIEPGERVRFKCLGCGHVTPIPLSGPPKRRCVLSENGNTRLAFLHCPHRARVLTTLSARTVGVGCDSTTAEVYHCRRFNEPVLKQAAACCLEKIAARVPGYKGRTCRECKVPMGIEPADIFHVTQKESWQIMRERGETVLRAAGMPLACAEITKPTPAKLTEEIRARGPRLVFVHAFAVEARHIIATAERFPRVVFVVVLHSQDNHVLTWPQFYPQIRDVLKAAQRLPNLWYAASEAGVKQWQALGYDRVIRFWQPCAIQPFRTPPTVDPPTVLISSRGDMVKAVPSQLIAAGILQRQRGVRVAVSLQSVNDQMLKALTDATGLRYDAWPWCRISEFVARLRDQVSIVLQPSMSETFNYVSWEAGSVGRPWVGSEAVRHTPPEWRADPNDASDIARVAGEILDDYPAASRQARLIAENVAAEHNAGYCDSVRRLIG